MADKGCSGPACSEKNCRFIIIKLGKDGKPEELIPVCGEICGINYLSWRETRRILKLENGGRDYG